MKATLRQTHWWGEQFNQYNPIVEEKTGIKVEQESSPWGQYAQKLVAIFTFMHEWNDYFAPLIYLNRPENYTLALNFKIWELTQQSGLSYRPQPYNRIMAIATLITLIPMVVFFFTQRYFIQDVVISGLKG